MKALHVVWSVDPKCGGPPNVVGNLVREQVRIGMEVAVLATTKQSMAGTDPTDRFVERMKALPWYRGAELHFAHAYGRRRPFSTFSYSPESTRWLRARLADPTTAPDVIHIHGVYHHTTTAAARLARRHGIPYFLEPFGALDRVLVRRRSLAFKRLFVALCLGKDLRKAACVHLASDHEAADVRHWAPDARIEVIPHGVEVPVFDANEASRAFLARFPQLEGKRVVLFLSRIDQKKRPELLVEAIARLRAEFPNLVLFLAGGDSGHLSVVERTARERGVSEAVVAGGFVDGLVKHGAFAVSDVFALPSVDENFAIAVVEAMAHGVPALVTPGVASHVYVDDSGGGVTVEGDVESIVAGLRQILAGDAKAMGTKGREYVAANLSWESIARRIRDLYEEALATRRSRV